MTAVRTAYRFTPVETVLFHAFIHALSLVIRVAIFDYFFSCRYSHYGPKALESLEA